MAYNVNPGNAEMLMRSSGFNFNGGNWADFGNFWNTVDPNRQQQLTNYMIGQGATAGDMPDIIRQASAGTPWGTNAQILGNPDARLAQDKSIVQMAADPNNLNAGNTATYNNMVGTGEIAPFAAPATNTNPAAITATPDNPAAGGDPYAGGVVPIGQVEPFNDYQKQAITDLAKPLTAGDAFFDTGKGLYASAAGSVQAGTNAMTDADFNAGISRYMNPYQTQVVDAYKANMTAEAEKAKAQLMSGLAGRKSFGDTSSGIQLSSLADNTQKNMGSGIAQLLYQGFNDAAGNTNTQFNSDQGRKITGGLSLAELTGRGFDLGSVLNAKQMQDIKSKLAAGGLIQNQNQSMLDAVNPDLKGVTNYPITNLTQLAEWLKQIPGGQTTTEGSPSSLSQIGGGLSALGSAGIDWTSLFGGGKNSSPNASLPWL